MVNRVLIILCLALWPLISLGQSDVEPKEKKSKLQINLTAGAAMPVGEFGTYEQLGQLYPNDNFNLAGEATWGFGAEVGLRYLLGKNFGLVQTIYGYSFSSEIKTSEDIFEQPQGTGTVTESNSWKTLGILVGGVYEIDRTKFRFGINLMAGFQSTTSPDALFITDIPEGPWMPPQHREIVQPEMESLDVAYRAGIYGGYKINKLLVVTLSCNYTTSSASFSGESQVENTFLTVDPTPTYRANPVQFDKKTSNVSILLGVGFNL
jgi:hypothetical protein